jgi:transposase
MNKEKRRKYDREFKVEAVKLVTERGTPIAEAARNLGIHENLLRTWKKKYLEDTADSFPGKGHLKPQDEQLRCLRKKLADVEEERDILKKALAIFSKEPK